MYIPTFFSETGQKTSPELTPPSHPPLINQLNLAVFVVVVVVRK